MNGQAVDSTPVPIRAARVLPALLCVAVLAASAVAWAAVPMSAARAGARPVLSVAIASALMAVARLAAAMLAGRPGLVRHDSGYPTPFPGFAARSWSGLRALPWAEAMTVGVLALEALHRSRPWHTVVLGVTVLAFLLTLHLAESGARPAALRPALPLIAVGLALSALSAVAAMLAAGGAILAVIAAVAAVVVAALALPV